MAAILIGAAAAAQPNAPAPGAAAFDIFFRGHHIGREQVTLARGTSGWIITSTGSQDAPFDLTVSRFEVKYTPDWQPLELNIEGRLKDDAIALSTSFSMTNAINEITRAGKTTAKTDQISAGAIVIPNSFYAGYEALAARLASTAAGDEVPIYVAPEAEVKMTVRAIAPAHIDTASGQIAGRRYDVTFHNPKGPLEGTITIDDRSRLVRVDLPGAGLQLVREDASGVGVRTQAVRNPNDADVTIPANGFNLAGTITTPAGTGRLRYPAVVLVGGPGPSDRDETTGAVPVFARLASALSGTGFIVLRYDKRGVGQSGGRIENATLDDYAQDAIAAVKWIRDRRDVDDRHVAVVGYGEGGFVAMTAARREKKIKALILMAAPGSTGAALLLEQQQRQLAQMTLGDADKQQKIDLQKKIQQAVITGKGWEGIPPAMRRQADTPEFRSLLLFDPSDVMAKIEQPVLVLQGDLDTTIPPTHAERLAELGRARKKERVTEVVHFSGLGHAFAAESASAIDPKVTDAIANWLKKIW